MNYNELQLAAATDPEFRERLTADPTGTLRGAGFDVPDSISVRIVESTPEELLLSIPPFLPDGAELDEDALASTSAGSTPLCIGATIAGGVGLGYLIFSNQGSSEPTPRLHLRQRR